MIFLQAFIKKKIAIIYIYKAFDQEQQLFNFLSISLRT